MFQPSGLISSDEQDENDDFYRHLGSHYIRTMPERSNQQAMVSVRKIVTVMYMIERVI